MEKRGKQVLSMLLCLTMLLTMLPMSALSFQEEDVPVAPVEAELDGEEQAEPAEEDTGLPAGEEEPGQTVAGDETGPEEGENDVPVIDGDMPDSASEEAESGTEEPGDQTDAPQEDLVPAGDEELYPQEDEEEEIDWDGADLGSALFSARSSTADGALEDGWAQDPQTVRGSGSVCTIEDGKLRLKVGSGNANNGDHWTGADSGTGPAVFLSDTMNSALQANAEGKYEVSFKMKPLVDGMCFGVYLNYKDPLHGALVGFNTPGGWFWQAYNGTGALYSTSTLPGPTSLSTGTTYQIEVSWDPSGKTATLKVDGTAVVENWDYSAVPNTSEVGVINNLGIKLGKANSGTLSEIEVWDIHYTGQADTVTVKTVEGTVKNEADTGLADAAVTLTSDKAVYHAVTVTDGSYTVENVLPGTYTVAVTKEGYLDGSGTVTVGSTDVTADPVTLGVSHTVTIPKEGALETWTKVQGSDAAEPEVVDGKLVLLSGSSSGNTAKLPNGPAIYTSTTMTSDLRQVEGKKWLSFTLTPECVKNNLSIPTDYLGFGITLNYNGQTGGNASGYFIGFATQDDNLFAQEYNGSGQPWGTFTVDGGLQPGQTMKFYIEWTDSTISMQVNGKTVQMFNNNAMTGTATNTVAFSVAGRNYVDDKIQDGTRKTKLILSDIHYSGQATEAGHQVAGTVRDDSGHVLKDAVVSAGNGRYTATTDANGSYSMVLREEPEAYTVTAELDGYETESKSVTVNAGSDYQVLENTNFTLKLLPTIRGTVKDARGKAVRAGITSDKRPEGKGVTSDENGAFTIIGAVDGKHTLSVTAEGYEPATVEVNVSGQDVTGVDIVLQDRQIPSHMIATADMEVRVAKAFPQVIDYKLLKLLDGQGTPQIMYGQTAELDTIKINGAAVKPTVTSVPGQDGKKVTYTMVIDENNNGDTGVTATITAELRVGLEDVNNAGSEAAGRTLGFYITGVEYAGESEADKAANRLAHPVDTIEIPNHSLVSVRSTQSGAAVTGAKLAANTTQRSDYTYTAADKAQGYQEDFFAAFVYNDQLSAGLSSNSAYASAGGSAGQWCNPVRAQFEAKDGNTTTSIGLGSTLWYYDHDITKDEAKKDDQPLTLDELPREKRIIAPLETPYAKVVIAGDRNHNNKVDWQDGAIALRETVMHIPTGGEGVADSVNLRISMNFGSMATNPFLIALDNVKRVAAHTDGLGQFVLLKGYAGEGHDSNHPQYDNIGERMGGAKDMLTLMEEGGKLGATFGIHTNASEFYTEAIEEESQVRRNTNGSIHYGWNWLDQGIAINAVYDYATGLRGVRWDNLYKLVKGYPFVVYVDVWGNNTSGTENDFMTRALSNEIVGHKGWRIAQEWAWANPYESTFQHWTTDFTYGNYSDKGKLNSNVLRFLLNQYKDSFVADFASYGGAANAPLLGGPAMQGFEGWQGDGEYNLSIYNTYNQMIYTKFLQHYPVVEWTNADNTVKIPYNGGDAGRARDLANTSDWTPEMQVKLSDGKDNIVVTRGTSGTLSTTASFSVDAEEEYRSRVVTLNGKVIVEGAPASAGEDNTFPRNKATLKYLIPWYWDNKGGRVDAQDEKLYHWNAKGGESTWQLPNGWENLSSVIYYELSDQGRGSAKTLTVSGGKITFPADTKDNTGYVVVKGEANKGPQITYGTGLHLSDPSFNLDTPRGPWTIAGNGSAVRTTNNEGISVLKLIGQVSVSQKLSGLTAGQCYAMYAAVDNRSNAKASMTITDGEGNVVATNYTEKSIARNYISSYYLHNGHGIEKGESYFQNMFLYFTPEAGKEYTLTLSRESGSGNVYFDDIRTVEYKGTGSPVEYDAETGAATELHQDFENVPQGIWPFVVGPVEGVADNRSHLSELNVPFTQAGWDAKKLDDVIDGKWSVKANGLHGRNNLVYQTIPQNFRFEPDKVYTVGFDYELGSEGSYVAVVGDGAYTGLDGLTVHNLDQTLNTTVPGSSGVAGNTTAKAKVGHIEFTVVGSKSGQTWVGIYSKENANNQGTSGSAAAFGGYLDFVLDNLTIELAPPEKNELALLLQEADTWMQEVYIETTAGDWDAFVSARDNGHDVFDDPDATQEEITNALDTLTTAMNKLTKAVISISGMVKNANGDPVEGAVLTLEEGETKTHTATVDNKTTEVLDRSGYQPVGLTITTGADGMYKFESKSGVELLPGTYFIKAEATGYYVTTTAKIEIDKNTGAVSGKDIVLEAEAPGAYVNDFNTGDISMMGYLVPEDTENLPTIEATEYNGSGAMKITWNAGSGETRHLNNVVDKTVTMANGTFSFDVVPLTNDGLRLGITFRGQEGTSANTDRVFVGQEDTVNKWFVEYWNAAGSPTTGWNAVTFKEIGLNRGVKRNVRAVMDNMRFQVYVDGVMIYDVDASDTLKGMPTEAGYVGFNMRWCSGSEYIIDNLRIIRADTAEGVQNVSGTVTARSGVAVSGAAVELYQGENRIAGTATNALGQYQVSRVEPGTYTMKVSAPFFQGKEETITVTDGSDLTGKDFVLNPDISTLTNLIEEIKALKENDYTPETWAPLAEALEAAEQIDGSSSIAALNTAYRDLSNARDGLVEKEPDPADYSALRAVYNEMALKEDTGYTAESWSAFQAALDKALKVLSKDATQQEIDEAVQALQSAYTALTGRISLAALQAAYDAARDVTNDNYTDNSWAAFTAARDRALELLTNADGLTQEQVDAAAKDLTDAQRALTKKSSGSSSGSSSEKDRDRDKTVIKKNEDGSVTTIVTKPNGTVTETTVAPDGGKVEKVTSPDKAVAITVTDPEGETLANVAIPAVIPTPETRFEDVPEGHWADEAIHHAAGLKLVEGVGGNQYDMLTPMTRGSLATVLHRLSQGKTDYEVVFSDVEQGKYYTQGVAWAARVDVVKGISEDLFAPDQIITREQLAVMLARYAKLIGMDTKANAKALNAFQDGGNTGDWAVDGVAWCVEKGILKGKGGNVLDPTADVSRAEVAVMLDRFIMLIK